MTKISLTQGKFALVDDADYEWLNQWKWQYHSHGYAHYRRRMGFETDHINRNKLDNRRCNLRTVTRSENQSNKPLSRNNTSGIQGVRFDKSPERHKKPWMAGIRRNKKMYNIGRFATLEDAKRALVEFKYE